MSGFLLKDCGNDGTLVIPYVVIPAPFSVVAYFAEVLRRMNVRNLSSLPLITEWLPFTMKNLDNPLYSSYNADKCRISLKVNVRAIKIAIWISGF